MTDIKDQVNLPINWNRLFGGSAIALIFLGAVGLVLKIRTVVMLADTLLVALFVGALVVFFISLVAKYGKPSK